jgi:hypothetical protein
MAHAGSELIANEKSMNPELADEVALKKSMMKPMMPTKSEVERLTSDNLLVQSEVQDLVAPKAKVEKHTIRKTMQAMEIEFEG